MTSIGVDLIYGRDAVSAMRVFHSLSALNWCQVSLS